MAYGFFQRGRQRGKEKEVRTSDGVASAPFTLLRFSCVLAVTLLLLGTNLRGQTSTVIGTITYRNGKPAVNVFVSIAHGYRYTDVGGRYRIDGIPQGKQHMMIKSGRNVLWEGDVMISGTTATVNRVLP
jgi:hypothetical protein